MRLTACRLSKALLAGSWRKKGGGRDGWRCKQSRSGWHKSHPNVHDHASHKPTVMYNVLLRTYHQCVCWRGMVAGSCSLRLVLWCGLGVVRRLLPLCCQTANETDRLSIHVFKEETSTAGLLHCALNLIRKLASTAPKLHCVVRMGIQQH